MLHRVHPAAKTMLERPRQRREASASVSNLSRRIAPSPYNSTSLRRNYRMELRGNARGCCESQTTPVSTAAACRTVCAVERPAGASSRYEPPKRAGTSWLGSWKPCPQMSGVIEAVSKPLKPVQAQHKHSKKLSKQASAVCYVAALGSSVGTEGVHLTCNEVSWCCVVLPMMSPYTLVSSYRAR